MTSTQMQRLTVRVAGIRSQNPMGFGGAIFTGRQLETSGEVADAKSYVVVKADKATLGGVRVECGQWWKVTGVVVSRVLDVNGFKLEELQMDAAEAVMLRPSGEHVVTYMAGCPAFEGIGLVKARRLWDAFGEELYHLLDAGEAETLSRVLTPEAARVIVKAWAAQGDTRTLQWLQAKGFDVKLGRKVVEFFGSEVSKRIEEDPYRLLSFCGSWATVDEIARKQFDLRDDDPRRLQGAVEEACYRLFSSGHTTALSASLMSTVAPLLGRTRTGKQWRDLVSRALSQGLTNGSFVIGHHGIQPLGAAVMEHMVAEAIAERLVRGDVAPLLDGDAVNRIIGQYEVAERLTLNDEQREAIHSACGHAFCCITGGAGVGKTTVLKALYRLYDEAGVHVVQVALAGRAAKRMQETTSRPASTIASFLNKFKEGEFDGPSVLVVDEASMCDIIAMSRICDLLPKHVRIVLVGDPNQLMPVGPGLVLHAITAVPEVPRTELKVVKRYGDGIHQVAIAIRDGKWPTVSGDESAPVAFLPCAIDTDSFDQLAIDLYALEPETTQILTPRRRGRGGSTGLNALCQARFAADLQPLIVWNPEHECEEHAGLHLGDKVLCVRNMWERGLQNGSLGRITEINDAARRPPTGDQSGEEELIAWIEWDDGIRRPLFESMLEDIELGYAITVHKAQGSQWPRILVPITESRLLDRTLLYTAVTRAQTQVILLGDEIAARKSTIAPPRARERQVALDLRLRMSITNSAIGDRPSRIDGSS